MGCGLAQNETPEGDVASELLISPVESYAYRHYAQFHADTAAGSYLQWFQSQNPSPQEPRSATWDDKAVPLLPGEMNCFKEVAARHRALLGSFQLEINEEKAAQLYKYYEEKRQLLLDEKERQLKSEEKPCDDTDAKLDFLDDSTSLELSAHQSENDGLMSFVELCQLVNQEMPHATQGQIYELQALLCGNEMPMAEFFSGGHQNARLYSITSFLKCTYMLTPENSRLLARHPLYALLLYADELYNTYFDVPLFLWLCQLRFGAVVHNKVAGLFGRQFPGMSRVDLDDFEEEVFPALRQLIPTDIGSFTRLKSELSKTDPLLKLKRDKADFKRLQEEIGAQINAFLAAADPAAHYLKRTDSQFAILDEQQLRIEEELKRAERVLNTQLQ